MILFFPAKAIYIVFFALALVYWGGGRFLRYAFEGLEITRTVESTRLFPGETAEVSIVFCNRTAFPIAWLSGYEHLPVALEAGRAQRWVVSLGPWAKTTVSYSITGSERGYYAAGPLDVSVGEPLGLHQFSETISSSHEIIVYPRISPLAELGLPSRLPYGNTKTSQPIFHDPSRLAGVRPYQSGDSRQSIHWKLTARTGELQVKQFQHTVAVDTMIFLNLNEEDYSVHTLYSDSELAIETAASLANCLCQWGESFGLISNGHLHIQKAQVSGREEEPVAPDVKGAEPTTMLLPRKGIPHLMVILETLASMECRPGPDFVPLLARETSQLSWGATLLVITPVDSVQLIETAASLVSRGYQVLVFVVGREILHSQLLHQSSEASLQLFRVRKDELIALGSA